MSNRFESIEVTDKPAEPGVVDVTQKSETTQPLEKTPKEVIEDIVKFMARNKIASIHVSKPKDRTVDDYKEVKYRTSYHK